MVDELAVGAEPGLVATPSGRFFDFVIDGALAAALAADWLTAVWDQNAAFAMIAPAEAAVDDGQAGCDQGWMRRRASARTTVTEWAPPNVLVFDIRDGASCVTA